MTISYKWLSEYLPVTIEPEKLSRILTSIGLEVEAMHRYEEVKGGMEGLLIGEVLSTEKHPNADKLTLTKVNIGKAEPLSIVCGAPNVATGQKVVVAPVGSTIYPTTGEPMTMRLAKIRGSESQGMICAEDEIGLGSSHAGIMVLPENLKPGTTAAEYFQPYEDHTYEIGLTPNRMDAMSHWGVARDVCAYLTHHENKAYAPKIPTTNGFKPDDQSRTVKIKIENEKDCPRFSGLSLSGITVGESPKWMQQRLKAIGLRPISNLVDITNYIQHETGQPLHAYDADQLSNDTIIVKNLPEGTPFVTLDEKERKLSAQDLMICDAKEGACIAGVFGGLHSGVTGKTKNIFLEAAFFNPITIRRTSFRHGLRTDAASRFEKGTDISNTVNVLKRAAVLIKEIAGGTISSDIVDLYPGKEEKKEVTLKYHYLKKLSGKNYHPDTVKDILTALGFTIEKEGIDELRVAVPYHKPDISLPADLVEEILRIDGLDNVAIPDSIMITPSVEENYATEVYREKLANYFVGLGFNEILTNSITNSAYFTEEELKHSVKMLNSLSAELNIMRPSMIETGLESIAHNLNRRNQNLRFFEFGKVYSTSGPGKYEEPEQLCLYLTGTNLESGWRSKSASTDFYVLKGIVGKVFDVLGLETPDFVETSHPKLSYALSARKADTELVQIGSITGATLQRFDIKQEVFFASFNWGPIVEMAVKTKQQIQLIPKFPAVQRDLALVVSRALTYGEVEKSVQKIRLQQLTDMKLFDIFESEKLGADRKSMAISFTFLDTEKTLTDKEIDAWMSKIMGTLEKDLQAEIRK